MNKKSISMLAGGAAVAAIASLALSGTAAADQTATSNSELGITTVNSSNYFGPAGKAADIDYSMYDRVNLGPLSATIWAPKRGAQGPMRDDAAIERQMRWNEIQSKLGPVGGVNTP